MLSLRRMSGSIASARRIFTFQLPASGARRRHRLAERLNSQIRNPRRPESRPIESLRAHVIICVHNALEDVMRCLDSVLQSTDSRHRLILVDDGSHQACRDYLHRFAAARPDVVLLQNPTTQGYTRAANRGLRASNLDYAVLLNSDTIVTPGWVERLLECGESGRDVGIVGPLSNSASWQSVPELFDATGQDWALNALPNGVTPNAVAQEVRALSHRDFPRVAFVNGFCFAIKREVIDSIGLFDEASFANYCEENDYCLRAQAAGFELAIADHAYVYHAVSRSYSHEHRLAHVRVSDERLRQKHDPQLICDGATALRHHPVLARMRRELGRTLQDKSALCAEAIS